MEKGVVRVAYHSLTIKESLDLIKSKEDGLSKEEADIRLAKFGGNELPEKKGLNPIIVFFKQFNSFLVYILLLAAFISWFVGSLIDMYVIIFVIIVNSSIGFFQEYKAENAISALKKMVVVYAKVYRDGELVKVPAEKLVPGDVIFIEEGDRIPADVRIIEVKNFGTVESSLTGESLPISKIIKPIKKELTLADRRNMGWMGTFASSGTFTSSPSL